MTVREICIKFGFEIDKGSEKKVRDTVESMKKMSSGLLKGFQVMFRASGAEDVVKEIQDSIDSLKQAEKAADDMEESFREMGDSASNAGKEISGAFKDIPESLPEVSELPVKRSSGQTEYIPEQTKHPVPETGSEHTPEQSRMPVESVHVDISRGIENIAAVSGKTMKQVLDDLERIAGGYEQLGMDAETSMKKAYNDIQSEQRKISLDAVAEETGKTSEEVQAELGRAAKAYEQLGMDAESAMKRAYGDIIKDSERASSEIEKMTVDLSNGFGSIAEESGKTIREVVADLKTAAAGYEKLGDDAETAMRKAYTDIQKNQKMLSLQKIAQENKKTVDEIQRDLQEAAAAYEQLGMDAESAMKRAYDDIIRDSERCSSQVKQNVSSNADAIGKSTNGIAGTLKKVARIAAVAFSAVKIKELGSECAEAAASANALSSQFEQTFGDLEGAAAKGLKKISEDTGVAVNRMKGSYAQIAAFAKTTGMSTEDSLELTKRSMVAIADSAAYYDRSLEDVTDSLQSFLKGNYENDAALGLSCTETTRNAAANALYGKSFKDLSEDQKQLTLLQMVEDANKLSGALGQAARESDTLENQTGNLKQSFQDLKAAIGQYLLQPVITGIKYLAKGVQYVTDKVPDMADAFKKAADRITGGEENVQRKMEQIHALVKRLQPAAERMLVSLRDGVAKAVSVVKMIVERFGGMENLLKLLAIASGAFLLVMNWGKIMDGARAFSAMLKSIGKMFSFANLKILGVVALVVLLALIVEDFINFLMGNDSLIGEIFDSAGIGADNAREAIFDAWDKISGFLLGVWDFIKAAAGMWIDNVAGFFQRHTESIQKNFKRAWRIVGDFLLGVWTFLSQLASALFGDTEESIDGSTKSTKDKLLAVWQSILDVISSIWDMLYEYGSAVFNALAAVIEFIFGAVKVFWDSWGSDVLSWFRVLWDSLGGILSGFLDVVKGVADFISAVFTGDWQGAWEAVRDIFKGVWKIIVNSFRAQLETMKLLLSMLKKFVADTFEKIKDSVKNKVAWIKNAVVSGITAAVDWIKQLPEQAVQWGADMIDGMIHGITGKIGGIQDAVSGVADKIKSFLHFSVPDEGPLTEYESWMPDFMEGLAESIRSHHGDVISAVKEVAGGISDGITEMNAEKGIAKIKWFCSSAVGILGSLRGKVSGTFSKWFNISSITESVSSDLGAVSSFNKKSINNIAMVTKSLLGAVNKNYGNVFGNIQTVVGNSFSAMQTKAFQGMSKMKSVITSGLKEVFDDIRQLPKSAAEWGADMVQGLADGIKGAVGKVKDAVGNIADNIKSYLHFSVPDEGPLTDYETWMPDFMQGLAKGIEDNKDVVLDTVRTLADGMSVLMQAASAHPETVAASTINNTNQSSVNQYNTFNSTYTGSDREAVRNVSRGMKKSATDATTELARALEFSRG